MLSPKCGQCYNTATIVVWKKRPKLGVEPQAELIDEGIEFQEFDVERAMTMLNVGPTSFQRAKR